MTKAIQKDLSSINWREQRDVDVAKILGVSRERARQLRNDVGVSCINERKSSKRVAIEKYLASNPTIPSTAKELYKELPVKVGMQSAYAIFKKLNLKLTYAKQTEENPVLKSVDWKLPNILIDAIWAGGKCNWAANNRSRLGVGASSVVYNIRDSVNQQLAEAKKLKISSNRRWIQKIIKRHY